MINNKRDLKECIEYERRIYKVSLIEEYIPFKFKESQILWNFMKTLRKTEYYINTDKKILKILYKLKLNILRNRYSLNIPTNVVGKGFSIAHLGPITINNECKIGENCRIHVGANIGANLNGGTPKLGNNIYIAPGAKIFGDIKIADNICIGANAVVNKSFNQNGITIAGVPAKKIKENSI